MEKFDDVVFIDMKTLNLFRKIGEKLNNPKTKKTKKTK
jgi:hypothetical protein